MLFNPTAISSLFGLYMMLNNRLQDHLIVGVSDFYRSDTSRYGKCSAAAENTWSFETVVDGHQKKLSVRDPCVFGLTKFSSDIRYMYSMLQVGELRILHAYAYDKQTYLILGMVEHLM